MQCHRQHLLERAFNNCIEKKKRKNVLHKYFKMISFVINAFLLMKHFIIS